MLRGEERKAKIYVVLGSIPGVVNHIVTVFFFFSNSISRTETHQYIAQMVEFSPALERSDVMIIYSKILKVCSTTSDFFFMTKDHRLVMNLIYKWYSGRSEIQCSAGLRIEFSGYRLETVRSPFYPLFWFWISGFVGILKYYFMVINVLAYTEAERFYIRTSVQ